MGPFNITSFHREYEYKLQSLLLLAFPNKLATNNIGSELIASLVALVCGFARQSKMALIILSMHHV